MVDDLRRELCALHAELPRNGLVAWTSGNVSARVPGSDELLVIKPSGIAYDDLRPERMVLCDFDGVPVEDALAPSSDAATHGHIYRELPDVGGIAHTHSPYATAWAIHGEPIPCVMTAMADEFGGEIPVGPFALIGDDAIGRGVVETLAHHRSCAVLMRAHGVFTVGRGPRDAVKAAVMCEDAARVVHAARSLGPLVPLDAESVDALYHRYQNVYGQH
ncbi:L-ribulose 5-phosphate 4-epimerase [Solirubrobacter pauli]|uniref:L-ribulose-5-phosphate 4-epimerase n=1 Tax=Solirubrobacter pauli TaxID=166793 RepID=A0A660KXE7_9ACTN|nr:L-ribulose-5-phosphate 4-epimerase [Solirubrobacter pauli]RKQ84971.1 L-ribulose 5-phosphate 4-epimerase [Solirubrobacter pauli]